MILGPVVRPTTAADVARYVEDMTGQMEAMARAAKLDLLAYFLSMARAESEAIAERSPDVRI